MGTGPTALLHAGMPRSLAHDVGARLAQLDAIFQHGDVAASRLLPTFGNRFQVFDEAGRFADSLITDVGAASDQVNLTFYAIHPGEPGGPVARRVTDALVRKAGEDVPVNVQIDALGSGLALRKPERMAFVEELRDGGVSVIDKPFTLGRGALDDARGAVDHRKLIEIDGRVSYHTGYNVVDAWSPWHDLATRVEGPSAAQAGAVLAGRWRDLGGEITPDRLEVLRRGMTAPVDDARWATRILTDGNRHRRELSDGFLDVARSAQERFWIMDPYLSDPRAMREIVGAAKRLGPDAQLFLSPKVIGGGQVQDVFTDPLRRAWAYRFAEAGGEVHVLPRFSHAKAWIADDLAGMGSHNKDRSSMRRSYENLVATNDPAAIAQLEDAFSAQRGVAAIATSDVVHGWRTLARVRDALHLQY